LYIDPILVLILHRAEETNYALPTRTERDIHPERFLLMLVLVLVLVLLVVWVDVILELLLRIPSRL